MKYILTILVLSCIGCSNNPNYLIKKGKVGKINSKSIVKDIDSLFSNDSIVKRIGVGDYMFESEDKYLIYDNLNNHLLQGLEPAGVPKGLIDTIIPFNFMWKIRKYKFNSH